MNIFKRVTKKTLKEAKTRTIVTIVGVVLATCLFTAATAFVSSMFNYAEEIEKTSGDYYVHLEDDDHSLYAKMKSDKEIAYMTKENYVGVGKVIDYDTAIKNRIEDGTYNEEIYIEDLHEQIYGIDENCFMIEDFIVENGRMPKSSKEIIISNTLAERLGDKGNVGCIINIPILKDGLTWGEQIDKAFSEDANNYIQEYQYTIVGHHDNKTGYDIYTYNDDNFVSKESNLYVKLHKKLMLDIEEFLAKYDVDIDDNEKVKEIRWSFLAFSGSFKDAEELKIYVWLFAIFFFIIAIASIVLISSTFMISLSERTKQFGLLSSIGATKKQLYKSLIYEASYVSAIGIPVGLFIGLGGMGLTIKLLGHKISRVILSMGTVDRTGLELKYVVYPITIIIALILTVVTIGISLIIPLIRLRKVTAIEAIRQSKEVKVKRRRVKVGRLTKRISGLEGILATKYYKTSSSKYRVTVISLAISMVLFVVTFSVSGMARIIVDNDMVDYPYDIRYQNIQISYDKNDLRDETTKYKEFIEKLKGLKGAGSVKYSYGNFEGVILKKENLTNDYLKKDNEYSQFVEQEKVEINDSNISDIPEKIYENIIIMYVDDVQYNEILEKEGLDKSKYIGVDEPKALVYNKARLSEENFCKVFNKDITSLTLIDSEKLDSIAMGYGYNYYYDYKLWPYSDDEDEFENVEDGKVIYYKHEESEEEFKKVGIKVGEMYTKELLVGDYISSLPYRSEDELYDCLYAIYPESAVKGNVYANAYINVKEYESYITDLYKLLESYDMEIESIEDFCKKNNMVETMLFIVKVFIYGFLILIALTSVANVFNTISTNIILRRRDIATLRSIGLSSKSVDKMMRYECFIYGIKATIIGIPLSIAVNYGISKVLGIDGFSEYGVNNITNYLKLLIPYKAIIIAVIVVLVIVYISMAYATNIIKKDNILDTLKNENI